MLKKWIVPIVILIVIWGIVVALMIMFPPQIIKSAPETINKNSNPYNDRKEIIVVKNNVKGNWGDFCSCTILTNSGNAYTVSGEKNCVKLVNGATAIIQVRDVPVGPGCDVTDVVYDEGIP